jgi:bifunctional DNA-binding transcriptional regulator/antitoxin component of YhaV-PrlF toxin-antitoxin module
VNPVARTSLSMLRELDSERRVSQWRYWIVGVESIGRITLPTDARRALDVGTSVQAVSRELVLVLHRGGGGVCLLIDRRGRLVLPAWLRPAVDASGSVLVAARAAGLPTVVVVPTTVVDDLVDHLAAAR